MNTLDSNIKDAFDLEEASQILLIEKSEVTLLCEEGKLKGFKIKDKWHVTQESLTSFLVRRYSL